MRVLVADDHAVVRRGLKAILAEEFGAAQVGEAQNAQEVLQRVREQDWDILVLDIVMPGRSGLEVLRQLHTTHASLPVLILSMYPEGEYALRALKAGAAGYLTKESAPDELVRAINKVVSGGKYVSESLAETVIDVLQGSEELLHKKLSDRELQVMCMLASGRSVSQIAGDLSLSVKTVSTYRSRVMDKMGMRGNVELARYALENGLIT